jgi:leader peptidase (prepilin peptidase)/N-methyltransferase
MTGFLFLVLLFKFGISWITLGNWLLFSWLLALAMIDLDTLTLPHPLTTSGLGMGLVFQVVSGLGGSSVGGNQPLFVHPMTSLMVGIEGAVLGIWLWDTIRVLGSVLLGRPAMGGGDANLSAMIGAWLGWKQLLLAGLIACWLGAMIGGLL